MRIPLSWLRDYIQIPADTTAHEIAEILTRIGFEEEEVISFGADIVGPIVVGEILEFVEEPQSNGKVIRWCQVRVGADQINGIVCGARNFFVGDKVVVSLPGAVLPGGFAIAGRKTYGHVSDGMICSARELMLSDDHEGIIRLSELGIDVEVGTDAIELLGLIDDVVDVSVLPDRGYAMSMRGIAREISTATGWAWSDPAAIDAPITTSANAVQGSIVDKGAASRLVLRTLDGYNPAAPSPQWMQRRLYLAGMRSISLAVDVTNYVMLEMGQPLHAFDADKLKGAIQVRNAGVGVKLETLDHVERTLDPHDIVIADDSGAVALAGTMGGASTEISDTTSKIVIEAACFSSGNVARTSRAHKLSSEASRRFERGMDNALAPAASARASQLLSQLGSATEVGAIEVDQREPLRIVKMNPGFPSQLIGAELAADEVRSALVAVGCTIVESKDVWTITVPSWRTDIVGKADLVEEIIRILGFERIPTVVPTAPSGLGLTPAQRLRRKVSRLVAQSGAVEVLSYPFMGAVDLDALQIPEDDSRRVAVGLANPISAEAPLMRTTLLAPLMSTARRNVGRGHTSVAVYEMGMVVLPTSKSLNAPQLRIDHKPSDSELNELNESVPFQPEYVAAVLGGLIQRGEAQLSLTANWTWADAIGVALRIVQAAGLQAETVSVERDPWHPGRVAAISVGSNIIGFAGELHPRVVERYGLPARSCAFELDFTALSVMAQHITSATLLRTFPKATFDMAFVVPNSVPAALVREVVERHASEMLESAEIFDVYSGSQVAEGFKSVAVALTLRASDRTLTEAEIGSVREEVMKAMGNTIGAVLR